MFTSLPFQLETNEGVRILMYPLRTTISMSCEARASMILLSCSSLLSIPFIPPGRGIERCSTDESDACLRPPADSTSEITRDVTWFLRPFD